MPLFDEINIGSVTKGDEVFINAKQLAWHIAGTMSILSDEALEDAKSKPFTSEEKHYFHGIMEGLNSVVLLLSHGGIEQEFHKDINSVEDIVEHFRSKDG